MDGVAPVMAVHTTSPITPDKTRLLDKQGRVVRVATEAFSGSNDLHYAAGTGGATVVTTTEKAYKGSTLDATLTTRTTYSMLGGARVEECRATTAAVTTTYTYDASGQLLTASAGTTRVAAFAYAAAGIDRGG